MRSFGQAVIGDAGVFERLIGELLTRRGSLWVFGEGLAEGSQDLQATWNYLRSHVAATPREKLNTHLLCGFLAAARRINPDLANHFLEDAVDDDVVGFWYPALEASVNIDASGAKRLMRTLSIGKAPIHMYGAMKYGGVTKSIPPHALKDLVLVIAAKPKGFSVAIEILNMRLHGEREDPPQEIREAGWGLLERLQFTATDQHEDYDLAEITRACLKGDEGAALVSELCRKLKRAIFEHHTHLVYYDDFLSALFSIQTKAALDAMYGGDEIELEREFHFIENTFRIKKLFGAMRGSDLLAWCDEKPASRYPLLAGAVAISTNDGGTGEREWSPIALRLLERAPDRVEVLKRLVRQIESSGGWGSHVAIVEANAKLLNKLEQYPDLTAFVIEEKVRLAQYVERGRQSEAASDRKTSDCFE